MKRPYWLDPYFPVVIAYVVVIKLLLAAGYPKKDQQHGP